MKYLEQLKHYFYVYRKFVSTSIAVNTSFRTSFVLLIVMDFITFLTTIYSIDFIYNHIETIGPWGRNELLFFALFMLTIDNLHMILFSESFWALSFDIKSGALDFTILKPMNTIFSVFFRYFRPSSCVLTPLYLFYLIKYGNLVGLGAIDWLLLPLFIFGGLTILVLIEFCFCSAMFWVTEGIGINFLRLQLQQLSRWPNFIYAPLARKFLTIAVPITLIGSAPVHFLLDKNKYQLLLLMPIMILILTVILNYVWSKGLRRYDSASS